MTDLETLVIEWRDAREAILLGDWSDPAVAKANVHLWGRLSRAESALMAHARGIPTILIDTSRDYTSWKPEPDTGSIEIIPPGPLVDPHQQGAEPDPAIGSAVVQPSATRQQEGP